MITNESDPNNDSGPGSFPASPADSVQASPHRPSASLPSAASPFQVSPATLNLIKDFMLKYAQPYQRQAFISDMLAKADAIQYPNLPAGVYINEENGMPINGEVKTIEIDGRRFTVFPEYFGKTEGKVSDELRAYIKRQAEKDKD